MYRGELFNQDDEFLESLKIKVFYYDPYLTDKFSAQKVESFEN